jgi:hypothetical protein
VITRVSALAEFIGREIARTKDQYEFGDRVASYFYEREWIASEREAIAVESFVVRAVTSGLRTSRQVAEMLLAEFGLDEEA